MATKNAFDSIATTAVSTSKGDQVSALTTPEIKAQIDLFVANKSELKRLEAEQAIIESDLINHIRPQQDEMARCGVFTKSLSAAGHTSAVKFVTMDKFSVPQDEESIAEIKKVVGAPLFKDMFETKRQITMKDTAIKDPETLNKIAAACEKAGLAIGDIFNVGDKVVAKDDLDRKQYELSQAKLEKFRTLVKQAKPSLR